MAGQTPTGSPVRVRRQVSDDGTREVSRIDGPRGVEAYLCVRPDAGGAFEAQARQAYARLDETLAELGASRADVLSEKVFLARIADAEALRAVRAGVYGAGVDDGSAGPATTYLQEPPCRPAVQLELQARVLFRDGADHDLTVAPIPADLGAGLARRVVSDGFEHLYLHNVTGGEPGDGLDYAAQTQQMFDRAEALLEAEGLTFRDVVRTWLYLPEMERDYADLNRVRSAFFERVGVQRVPASTGIQGGVWPADRLGSMDVYALRTERDFDIRQMHAPTLNEAWSYGSRFSRGMEVTRGDRTVLYVSGTASIDETGEVYAVGDIEAQVERMLTNVEGLLEGSLATPADIVRVTTYLKEPGFYEVFVEGWRRRGFPLDVPHTICVADVCRPEWLCETEVAAVFAPRRTAG